MMVIRRDTTELERRRDRDLLTLSFLPKSMRRKMTREFSHTYAQLDVVEHSGLTKYQKSTNHTVGQHRNAHTATLPSNLEWHDAGTINVMQPFAGAHVIGHLTLRW